MFIARSMYDLPREMQLRVRVSVDGVRVPTLVGLLVAEKDPTEVGTLTPFARASRLFRTLTFNYTSSKESVCPLAKLLDSGLNALPVQARRPLLHTTHLLPSRCCRQPLVPAGPVRRGRSSCERPLPSVEFDRNECRDARRCRTDRQV